jgi:hypothetical protein
MKLYYITIGSFLISVIFWLFMNAAREIRKRAIHGDYITDPNYSSSQSEDHIRADPALNRPIRRPKTRISGWYYLVAGFVLLVWGIHLFNTQIYFSK